jgi:hypothetical protein
VNVDVKADCLVAGGIPVEGSTDGMNTLCRGVMLLLFDGQGHW